MRFLARLATGLLTLILAVSIAFLVGRATGDPVRLLLGPDASAEAVAVQRSALGLDDPLPVQYVSYMSRVARGDLGQSLRFARSDNLDLIARRAPASFQLATVAMGLAIFGGMLLGVAGAVWKNTWVDRLSVTVSLLGQSLPLFWLGMMLILLVALNWNILPAGQAGSWRHVILPAVTLSVGPLARIARVARSSTIEALGQDYILSARARGLSELRVTTIHGVRNALLPVVTIVGLQTGALLSSTVSVELVFAWPGLGTLAIASVLARDFELVQAIVVVGAVIFVSINTITDLLYTLIDPRIRTS